MKVLLKITDERSEARVERNWVHQRVCWAVGQTTPSDADSCERTTPGKPDSTIAAVRFSCLVAPAAVSNRKRFPAIQNINAAMPNHKMRLPIKSGVNGIDRVFLSLTVQYFVACSKGADPKGSVQAATDS